MEEIDKVKYTDVTSMDYLNLAVAHLSEEDAKKRVSVLIKPNKTVESGSVRWGY